MCYKDWNLGRLERQGCGLECIGRKIWTGCNNVEMKGTDIRKGS